MPKTEDESDDFLDTSPKKMREARNNRLELLFERIERLTEEKKAIADDIKDVFAEAKATGFDTKIMRYVLALRKLDKDSLAERDALIDTYRAEVGL